MKIPFRRAAAKNAAPVVTPTLVMREIFSDAMPEGVDGDLNALKDQLVEAEKVHPFNVSEAGGKYAQLDRCRLAKKSAGAIYDKHCYGLFEQETGKLRTVVYVNLVHAAGKAGAAVNDAELPGNIRATLNDANAVIEKPDTAIFYSISSMNAAKDQASATIAEPSTTSPEVSAKQRKRAAKLVAKAIEKVASKAASWDTGGYGVAALTPMQLSEGEQLIRAVAAHVGHAYGITAFSTLSPMRSGIDPKKVTGFASWLKGKLGDAQSDILTPSEQAFLEDSAAGANHYERIAHLHQNYAKLEAKSQKQFEMLMEDLGTYYIAYERNQKKNDRPLDPVTGFHIGNGAKLANLHYLPADQTTLLDNTGSFGMMANYRYEPDILSKRKQIARTENTVPLTPAFAARYTARLAELGKPFKLGKRTALPTEPVVTDAPQEVGNTLMLSAEQHPRAALRSWQGLVAATKSAAPNLDEHAR